MSLALINQLSREAAVKARRAKREPLFLYPEDLEALENGRLTVPFIGDYVAKGWERVDNVDQLGLTQTHGVYDWGLFVDHSGFGSYGEPAMRRSEFLCIAEELACRGYALAAVEQGQFQTSVGVFRRK